MSRSRSETLHTGFVPFVFPTLVETAPDGAEWLHEVKYDSHRTQAVINGKSIWAFTRNRYDWTERYAPIVASARTLRCRSAIIDGEMCVQDEAGVTRFNAIRSATRNAPESLVFLGRDVGSSCSASACAGRPVIQRRLARRARAECDG